MDSLSTQWAPLRFVHLRSSRHCRRPENEGDVLLGDPHLLNSEIRGGGHVSSLVQPFWYHLLPHQRQDERYHLHFRRNGRHWPPGTTTRTRGCGAGNGNTALDGIGFILQDPKTKHKDPKESEDQHSQQVLETSQTNMASHAQGEREKSVHAHNKETPQWNRPAC